MTDIGYKDIINRITNREVSVPQGLKSAEIAMWLKGASQTQMEIINIIEEMQKGVENNK